MTKKRVLVFIDWFLPGYKAGGPISSNANLVDHLSGEFEFYIITRNTDYCETTPYASVTSDAWNLLPGGAHVYYVSAGKLSFKTLSRVCREVDFDLVFINGIYSLYFSIFPLVKFKYFEHRKVVVSARGMLSDHTFSSKRFKKKLFYFLARTTGLYKGIILHATNDNEAQQIRKNVGFGGEIRVAPNLPPRINQETVTKRTKVPGEVHLVSIARISPEKNTLYMLEVLENLCRKSKTKATLLPFRITLDLYGTIYDSIYWKQCGEIISRLPANVLINYGGSLEKPRISEMLSKYHFLFMPTLGENYGHSIVESFLAGCPVIISDRTPWKKLEEKRDMGREAWDEGRGTEEDRGQRTEDRVGTRDVGRETRGEGLETWGKGQKTWGLGQETWDDGVGVGWDIALEQPERYVKVIEQCVAMSQEAYDAMSSRAFGFGTNITNDAQVMEANRKLFG